MYFTTGHRLFLACRIMERCLARIVKDAVPRYQTMKGKRVERVWGWDCHGLPAERYTEKKLGIHSREEVLEYGIEKYIVACRETWFKPVANGKTSSIGLVAGSTLRVLTKPWTKNTWKVFGGRLKNCTKRGKIYEGEKVLMYCTLDATPLSKAEVTMDAGAYQDVTDPSVYVKFKLERSAIAVVYCSLGRRHLGHCQLILLWL